MMKTGGCHCGTVRYSVTGALRDVIYCHCTQCRKQTGHFVAATRILDDALSITGADELTWYAASSDAKRGFCRHCGSLLFWKAEGSDMTSIMAGSLDLPTGLTASHHIFAADKGDYYELADGLPVFEGRD
ncbi:GFA family protein [Oceaniradius stylonematis]|uniref:GFA family protein n=1 Tax=Oceaniradius stylonematis TaxID=2184161 RepID=UPI003C7EBDBC